MTAVMAEKAVNSVLVRSCQGTELWFDRTHGQEHILNHLSLLTPYFRHPQMHPAMGKVWKF